MEAYAFAVVTALLSSFDLKDGSQHGINKVFIPQRPAE
jgi:hypothetical protein